MPHSPVPNLAALASESSLKQDFAVSTTPTGTEPSSVIDLENTDHAQHFLSLKKIAPHLSKTAGCMSFGIVDNVPRKNYPVRYYSGAACLYQMYCSDWSGDAHKTGIRAVVSMPMKHKDSALLRDWVAFILDKEVSPYRSMIRNYYYQGQDIYDTDFVLENGYYHFDNNPVSHVASLMIMFREVKEHTTIITTWANLVDRGIHPAIAFVVSRWFSLTKYSDVLHPTFAGHSGFDTTYISVNEFVDTLNRALTSTMRESEMGMLYDTCRYSEHMDIAKTWFDHGEWYGRGRRNIPNVQDYLAENYKQTKDSINHCSFVPVPVSKDSFTVSGLKQFLKDKGINV